MNSTKFTEVVYLENNEKKITLVGVRHIGCKYYYDQIFDILSSSEVVLYEGVKSSLNKKTRNYLIGFSMNIISNFGIKYLSTINYMQQKQYNKSIVGFDKEYFHNKMYAVFQGDYFKYDQLTNKINADQDTEMLSNTIKICSRTNLRLWITMIGMYMFSKISDKILSNIIFTDYEDIISDDKDIKENNDSIIPDNMNNKREEEILRLLDSVDSKEIGILYGQGHMDNILSQLHDLGYQETAERQCLIPLYTAFVKTL